MPCPVSVTEISTLFSIALTVRKIVANSCEYLIAFEIRLVSTHAVFSLSAWTLGIFMGQSKLKIICFLLNIILMFAQIN